MERSKKKKKASEKHQKDRRQWLKWFWCREWWSTYHTVNQTLEILQWMIDYPDLVPSISFVPLWNKCCFESKCGGRNWRAAIWIMLLVIEVGQEAKRTTNYLQVMPITQVQSVQHMTPSICNHLIWMKYFQKMCLICGFYSGVWLWHYVGPGIISGDGQGSRRRPECGRCWRRRTG